MRIYGCTVCTSAWADQPLLEPDGSHFSDADFPCRGVVEPFLPERMAGADAAAVLRAEAIAAAAIARAEAVASQAQRAVADLYFAQNVQGRASVRAYRAVLRAERAEATLRSSEDAPAATMRALLACERFLAMLERRRPCPSCRAPERHRRLCRLERLLDRIMLLRSPRKSPHKIRRARRLAVQRRGA